MKDFIFYVELFGITAFAIAGAMEAIKNKLDFLGVIILGVVTSTGGGVIRDMTLGITPPLSFRTGINIYIAIICSVIVFVYSLYNSDINNRTVKKVYEDALVYSDAIGLGVFTITGMQLAYSVAPGHSMILYIFIGMITGVGGGIIRDLLTDTIPFILDGNVYASASITGALLYHFLKFFTAIPDRIGMGICMILIIIIRIIAYHRKWYLPKATRIVE